MRIRIAECGHRDEEELLLGVALCRSSAARASRLAARVAGLAGANGPPEQVLADLGVVARASAEMERLLVARSPYPVRLHSFLERFATLRGLASGVGMRLRTSIADVEVDADLARCAAHVLCELIQMAECMGDDTPDILVAVQPENGALVIALAVIGADRHPVPSARGSAALRRAERLVHSVGGAIGRGVRDGQVVVGVTLHVTEGAVRDRGED